MECSSSAPSLVASGVSSDPGSKNRMGVEYASYDDVAPVLLLSMELPEANSSHKVVLDKFMKSPSQDAWQELVESMIRQRKEQSSGFYHQRLSDGSPRRTSPRRSRRSPQKNISSSRSPPTSPPRQFLRRLNLTHQMMSLGRIMVSGDRRCMPQKVAMMLMKMMRCPNISSPY